MKQYRFTSAALTELRQAIVYYEQRENGLGAAFLDEIEATVNRYILILIVDKQLHLRVTKLTGDL